MELGAFFKYAPHGMEEDVSAARWFVSGPLALGGLLTVHFAAAKMVLCPSRKQVQKLAAAQSKKYRGYELFPSPPFRIQIFIVCPPVPPLPDSCGYRGTI